VLSGWQWKCDYKKTKRTSVKCSTDDNIILNYTGMYIHKLKFHHSHCIRFCALQFFYCYCYYHTCLASFLPHNHDIDSDSLPVYDTMTVHDDQQRFCCLIAYKSILDCTRLAMNLHMTCITHTSSARWVPHTTRDALQNSVTRLTSELPQHLRKQYMLQCNHLST